MKFLGPFQAFAERVLDAVSKGGLSGPERVKLNHLLERTGKRNVILAKGILTALDAGGADKKTIERFGQMLDAANQRIMSDKPPFTKKDEAELAAIFRSASISGKTTKRFTRNIDELLAEQINESIRGRHRVSIGLLKKKAVQFEEREKKKVSA